MMVGSWRLQHERAVSKHNKYGYKGKASEALRGGISPESARNPLEGVDNGGAGDGMNRVGRQGQQRGQRQGRRGSSVDDDDEIIPQTSIDDLERRRGGSPPASNGTARTVSGRSTSSLRRKFGPRPSRKQPSTRLNEVDVTSKTHSRAQKEADEDEDQDENEMARTARESGEIALEVAKETVMHSENRDGWWMYVSMVGVVIAALAIGMF